MRTIHKPKADTICPACDMDFRKSKSGIDCHCTADVKNFGMFTAKGESNGQEPTEA